MRRPSFLRKAAFPALTAVLVLLPPSSLFCAELSSRVAAALSSVFEKPQGAEMDAAFVSALRGLSSRKERMEFLSAFADYEERAGLFESAAAHYVQAAGLAGEGGSPGGRQGGEYFSLCLDAARCYIYINETEKANSLIEKTLLECFDAATLFRARFYSSCARLSGPDSAAALAQLRVFLSIEGFAPYFPQILFILWHAAGDAEAGERLTASYPNSAEAAIARGDASVLPRAFWYFMPKGNGSNAAAAGIASPAPQSRGAASDPLAAGIWQQTGFFRSRANAEAQASELSRAGFRVFIREETRPSGNVFFSVLVPEDEAGTTAIRLKESGFESYLVTD